MKEFKCSCDGCKNACKYKPGWFLPEQVKDLLAFFNVKTVNDLLKKGFAIDWWNEKNDILVLAPNIKGNNDLQYPSDPRGECVFFEEGNCKIYDVRPFECKAYSHKQSKREVDEMHDFVAKKWNNSNILKEFEDTIICHSFGLLDLLGA